MLVGVPLVHTVFMWCVISYLLVWKGYMAQVGVHIGHVASDITPTGW